MLDILEISKKVWHWTKWPIYIVASILIFLGITQLVECFGADASNKFAGIFTPLLVAAVTIYLSNRQHNIADAQRAVAEESKNIAATNRDIAERKLKLELFEKRYELYYQFIRLYLEYKKYYEFVGMFNGKNINFQDGNSKIYYAEKYYKFKDELTKIYNDMYSGISKISFLFDDECHDSCLNTMRGIEKLIVSVRIIKRNEEITLLAHDYSLYAKETSEKFSQSKEMLEPYMSLKGIA